MFTLPYISYLIGLFFSFCFMFGLVLPAFISAASTEAVLLGVVAGTLYVVGLVKGILYAIKWGKTLHQKANSKHKLYSL